MDLVSCVIGSWLLCCIVVRIVWLVLLRLIMLVEFLF